VSNNKSIGDIDIDVQSRTDKSLYGIRAIIYDQDKLRVKPHPSGYYMDSDIPVDPETGMSALEYKESEELGFSKIDLLTATAYDRFKTKQEVLDALKNPNWDLLLDRSFVEKLPQLGKHFELVEMIKPQNIQELADILALIRPDKKHLVDKYIANKEHIRPNIYRRGKGGYRFKKAHAIAYAHQIVCVMNKCDVKGLLVY